MKLLRPWGSRHKRENKRRCKREFLNEMNQRGQWAQLPAFIKSRASSV